VKDHIDKIEIAKKGGIKLLFVLCFKSFDSGISCGNWKIQYIFPITKSFLNFKKYGYLIILYDDINILYLQFDTILILGLIII
jgi:hypothetical protein